MKDKIQEAAEQHMYNSIGDLIGFLPKSLPAKIEKAFTAGATYMQEQNKEAIQELVSDLEYAIKAIRAVHSMGASAQIINRLEATVKKHKQ